MSISPVMQRLSGYIAQAGKKQLPPRVVEKTKHHVLDTIAVTVEPFGAMPLPGSLVMTTPSLIVSENSPRSP